jgi:hypothetical protein
VTPSRLIAVMSDVTGIPAATVTIYLRVLREEGLITTGARGVNAPPLTPLDAARLLIAIMTTDKPSRAAQAAQDIGRMICVHAIEKPENRAFAFDKARKLGKNHDFETAVAALIDMFARDRTKPYFKSAQPPVTAMLGEILPLCMIMLRFFGHSFGAVIRLPGCEYSYEDRAREASFAIDLNKAGREDDRQAIDEAEALADAHAERAARYRFPIHMTREAHAPIINEIGLAYAGTAHE